MRGIDQHTHDEVAVTHPLTPGICPECRGEEVPAYPRAAHRGICQLVHTDYWREIERASELEFLAWCRTQNLPLFDDDNRPLFFYHQRDHAERYKEIRHSAVEDMSAEP